MTRTLTSLAAASVIALGLGACSADETTQNAPYPGQANVAPVTPAPANQAWPQPRRTEPGQLP